MNNALALDAHQAISNLDSIVLIHANGLILRTKQIEFVKNVVVIAGNALTKILALNVKMTMYCMRINVLNLKQNAVTVIIYLGGCVKNATMDGKDVMDALQFMIKLILIQTIDMDCFAQMIINNHKDGVIYEIFIGSISHFLLIILN